MAILETEVLVRLSGNNVKHYEDKGYDIPRYKDKKGRLLTKKDTKILVKVLDLKDNSTTQVTKVCDVEGCGKEIPNQRYGDILKSRENGDGKDRCFDCGSKKAGKSQKSNVKYENSLEFWANNNNKQILLKEFSSKNTKLPSQVTRADNDKYWWNCSYCDNEYDMEMSKRTSNGHNCPYCSGNRINHTNCLSNTHPEIAELLKNPERGFEITAGSGKKEEFTCPDCGNSDKKIVVNIVKQGYYSCKRCGDSVHFPEKFMFAVLSELEMDFETQKTFDWSKNVEHENSKLSGNKKYDFHVPSSNMIIETHGVQHYEESFGVMGGRNLQEEQENDRFKEELALKNGIKKENYIVIDCRYSKLEWIKNNIENSMLAEVFDLSDVDWMKCNEYATSNMVKSASEYWNSGIKSTVEIGKLMKLHTSTVSSYLKRAVELSWVSDYDPKEIMKLNAKANGVKRKKEVVQLSLNGEFISKWESAAEACKQLRKDSRHISSVCNGKRNSACGFKWMFLADYQEQLLQTKI